MLECVQEKAFACAVFLIIHVPFVYSVLDSGSNTRELSPHKPLTVDLTLFLVKESTTTAFSNIYFDYHLLVYFHIKYQFLWLVYFPFIFLHYATIYFGFLQNMYMITIKQNVFKRWKATFHTNLEEDPLTAGIIVGIIDWLCCITFTDWNVPRPAARNKSPLVINGSGL